MCSILRVISRSKIVLLAVAAALCCNANLLCRQKENQKEQKKDEEAKDKYCGTNYSVEAGFGKSVQFTKMVFGMAFGGEINVGVVRNRSMLSASDKNVKLENYEVLDSFYCRPGLCLML